jgi:2-polyprenyl-6-methoxyphenol hydroxylase-like FAD-dependent oxidoreductase
VAARTPAITSAIIDLGDFPLPIREIVEDGLPWAYGPRRTTLDKILVDAAAASGAEVRDGFHVDDYIADDGAVVGVRGRGADGRPVEEHATITIGADGRNSRLARFVNAPTYNEVPPILCYYFSYWQDVEAETFEMYVRSEEQRVVFSFRTEDDLFAVFVGFPADEFPRVRGDIEGRSCACSTRFRDSASASAPAAAPTDSMARRTCRTFTGSRTARGGHSSATPGFTKIRFWPWASATRFATSSSSPTRSPTASVADPG